ncbi:diguanylate cyclase with Cache1 sensor [Desulfovibrio sp. X2]|uniref:sensor domain-containing diguanylate cyclase n=1 Tax=Desulfovibrio sp. X2 TaxID=941449 RepID=UPI000358D2DA|nr:sensor domain-containing diguanylate cyclase [Desulfovibrio sp. X2]EPR43869.1 diguanylate cyclase with Cache1 sensor [Desulfovibrio sp. X2]
MERSRLRPFSTIKSRIRAYSILLVVLPLLISSLVFLFYLRSFLITEKQHEMAANLAVQAEYFDKWMRERQADVVFLAGLPEVRDGDLRAIQETFSDYVAAQKEGFGVVYAGPNGRTVVDTSAPSGVDLSDRAYFAAARRGLPYISEVLVGRTSGKAVMIFSAPVVGSHGNFRGVVFTPVRMDALSGMLERVRLGSQGRTFLITEDGRLLSRLERRGLEKSESGQLLTSLRTPALIAAAQGVQPSEPYADAMGKRLVGAWARLSLKPWLLVAEIPEGEVVGGALSALALTLGGAFLTILLITPLLIRLANSISQPVSRLAEFSESMQRGDYDATCQLDATSNAPVEVQRLYGSFCSLGDTVRSTIRTLEETTITDQLTGVHNRRFLMREGERLMALAVRGAQPLCGLMLDIDHFKRINDRYGHQPGDAVLAAVAQAVASTVRASDVLARIGGEEFFVLTPGADEAQAAGLAERIRQAVAARVVRVRDAQIRCTVSIGVAELGGDIPSGPSTMDDLLARADKALYAAKSGGRNRVVPHSLLAAREAAPGRQTT